jgi:hypothetical protein
MHHLCGSILIHIYFLFCDLSQVRELRKLDVQIVFVVPIPNQLSVHDKMLMCHLLWFSFIVLFPPLLDSEKELEQSESETKREDVSKGSGNRATSLAFEYPLKNNE